MKKIKLHLSIIVMLIIAWSSVSAQAWDGTTTTIWTQGDGLSPSTAYEISTPENLAYLAQQVNAVTGYAGTYFKMTSDLDLGNFAWTRIGLSQTNSFKGIFDGSGYVVSNLFINRTGNNSAADGTYGLFGYVYGGTIRNLGISSGSIEGFTIIGALVGVLNTGTIEYCYNKASIKTARGGGQFGGLIGSLVAGTVQYCYNAGTVLQGTVVNSNIGGIVGQSTAGTIQFCFNTGLVSGNNGVAGIVGSGGLTVIHDCYNTGIIKGKLNFGGIAGNINNVANPAIEYCYATGYLDLSERTGGYGAILGSTSTRLVNNSFYDIDNVKEASLIAKGTPLYTSAMIGDGLKIIFGETNWVFSAGLYPHLMNLNAVNSAHELTGSNTSSANLRNTSMDVSVLSSGTLTIDAPKTVNSLTIYPEAKLDLSTSILTVTGDLTLKADKTSVPSVSVTGAMNVSGNLKLLKAIDNTKWYFMSFPCDVSIDDITQISGSGTLGTIGTNWWIKYYDGASRATNYGLSSNWKQKNAGETLKANQGYIIGLDNSLTGDYVLSFPLNKSLVTSAESSKTVTIDAYGEGTSTPANSVGWNLVGIPYLSKFAGNGVGATYLTFLQRDYLYTISQYRS